jgi:prolyl-tRNA synthetase
MAGAYDYLPLGLRVLEKIKKIIREEMDAIGGQELLMTTLQDPEIWKKTDRWDDEKVDIWFKTKLKNGSELGIANTHEEPITALLSQFVNSYKDLPLYIYQFQTKFRNELRAKSGIMRVREFLMKDMYSFSRTEEEFKEFYEKCAGAYMKIFDRTGLGDRTYRTIAAGGSFTSGLTDEFQTLSETGEDIIYIDKKNNIAINKEVYNDENLEKFSLDKLSLKESKSIEVGNIFPLGFKYSETLGLKIKDEKGENKPIIMGSYGIGLGRLMGAVVETLSDQKGIVWPRSISPFDIHLMEIAGGKPEIKKKAEEIYKRLGEKYEVLYDDRDLRAGEKFADADLLGIPTQIIVGEKSMGEGLVEIKNRKNGESVKVKEREVDQARF